jgi:hypothetical protein
MVLLYESTGNRAERKVIHIGQECSQITVFCSLSQLRGEENSMKESILKGKRILAVDDERDVLAILEEEILGACPDCRIDKASQY